MHQLKSSNGEGAVPGMQTMRAYAALASAWLLMLGACRDLGPQSVDEAEAITADYSGISDPRSRWEAYRLKSYALEQQRMCFCINGGETCLVYVSDDAITDVVRKSDGKSIFQQSGYFYKTANQLLRLADSLKTVQVASLVVEYDPKFGFPKYMFVDPYAQMADEEYGYHTTSVRKLLK
jgi:Family of unknown function (DUF6174)